MPETAVLPENGAEFVLPPMLDLNAAAELKRELIEVMGSASRLNINASAVQRVTTPCLQVLLAAKNAAEAGNVRWRMHSVPKILSDAIGMLGLTEALGNEEDKR